MAILFESSTLIEFLLKDALCKEGLTFYEQYRIGTGGRFSTTKYVADFLVVHNNIRLIIECDGYTYHSGKSNKEYQVKRDAWLSHLGYKVLHFSTKEVKYNRPFVINAIKYHLGIIDTIPTSPPKRYPPFRYAKNNPSIALMCYYYQLPQGVCIAYMYEEKSKHIFSKIRTKLCSNVAATMAEATAIYLALLDVKKSSNIHVFYDGEVLENHFDVNQTIKNKITVFEKGMELLKTNTFNFTHINLRSKYASSWLKEREIIQKLKDECMMICKKIVNGEEFVGEDYQLLIASKSSAESIK